MIDTIAVTYPYRGKVKLSSTWLQDSGEFPNFTIIVVYITFNVNYTESFMVPIHGCIIWQSEAPR